MRVLSLIVACALMLTGCSIPPWKEYSYPAWGFAASFRVPPKATEAAATPAVPHNIIVEANQAGRDFVVAATDASGSGKSDDEILAQVPQAMAQGGTLRTPTYAAIGKVVGREALIDKPGQPTERVRVFVANHVLYQIAATSPLGPDDPEVADFLGRVRLLGQ